MHSSAQVVQTPASEEQRRRAQADDDERQRQANAPRVELPDQQFSDDLISNTHLPDEATCFAINTIALAPSDQLPAATQRLGANRLPQDPFYFAYAYLQNYSGRCIGKDGINLILKRLTARILEKGYSTTRVGVSEQNLSDGTLTFTLVPGMIHTIRFNDPTLYGTWRNAFPGGAGKLLNLRDLEQGLEQMKRVPSQDVDMQIVPTEVPGESDIVLNVVRSKPWKLIANIDNSGSDGTGKKQSGVTLAVDNPLGISDLLNVGINSDANHEGTQRGTSGQSFYYGAPAGYASISVSASDYDYHQQIAGIAQTYLSSGKSKNLDFKTDYLFQRDQSQKNSFRFDLSKRWSSAYLNSVEIEAQERDVSYVEFGWGHTQYLGQAQLDFTLSSRYGTSWFGGQSDAKNRPNDYPTYAYTIQTLDATFSIPWQVKDQLFSYSATLRAQTTHSPLYLVDQFSIGGRYTVRGFDGELTLTAERGYYLRNELSIPIAQSGSAGYLAVDTGKVFGPGVQYLVGDQLIGAAMGLRGNYKNFSYDVFTSWPISKPLEFNTDVPTVGFSLTAQY